MSDAFTDIIAGAAMGEWPDPGYETIQPYRLKALQEALIDHMVALGTIPEDGRQREEYLNDLQRLYTKDFEQADVFTIGDSLKFSHGGVLMIIDEEGNGGIEILDASTFITGKFARPVVLEVPLIPASLEAAVSANDIATQICVCAQLSAVEITLTDDDGSTWVDTIDDDSLHVYMQLNEASTKVQRQISPRDDMRMPQN